MTQPAKIRLPYPHAGQQTVRRQARRFNWLAAGRRWRKTTLCMSICVEASVRGGQYIWGAPTYEQSRIAFEETQTAAHRVATFNQSRMTATFPGGGVIFYRSLDDPDNVRGHTANGVVIDECGDVVPIAWYEVMRPMLIDTNGWAWGIGSPKGYNWFHDQHLDAPRSTESMAWQAPTLGVTITEHGLIRTPHPLENPDIPFAEIEHLFRTMPLASFRQEILAEFVDSGLTVFSASDLIAAEIDAWGQREPQSGHVYAMGVDIGRRRDATVINVADTSIRPFQRVYHERLEGVPYPLIQQHINAAAKRYRCVPIVESNGVGDPVIENLDVRAEPFVTTARTKTQAIQALQLLLEQGDLKARWTDQERREMTIYAWDDRALQQDCVMSLAILADRLTARPIVVPPRPPSRTYQGA